MVRLLHIFIPLALYFGCAILLVSCHNRGKIQITIESGKADNTGYTVLLYTLQSRGLQVDTLSFTAAQEEFSYTFDADSLYGGYIVVGNFEQYYPLDLHNRSKIRFHIEVASPHNSYDLYKAKKTGYGRFLKENAALLRSYDKALAEQDTDKANKDAKLVSQQFVSFASSLTNRDCSHYLAQMDWGIEIMSLYEDGLDQLRKALSNGSIDSTIFSPKVYEIILSPLTTTGAMSREYPVLQALNRHDTISWRAKSYPRGSIIFGNDLDWRNIRLPKASSESINLLLPLGSIDSLAQIANRLGAYSYIVDAPEPLCVRLYQALSLSRQSGIICYSTGDDQRLVIDSIGYIQYNE